MYEKGDMGNPYRWEFQEKKSFVMRLGSQSISSFLALSLVAIIAAASVSMVSSEVVAYKSEADVVNRQTFGYRSLSHEGSVLAAVTNNVDPLLLPKATGQGTPATNPQASTQPNSFYLDPTSGAKVWRATGPSYPCANNGGDSFHDYGDITQISLDMGGAKHTLLIHTCGDYKLVDFTRGVGFSNWRNFAQGASPNRDLDFTFSNKLETPHIAYVLSGTKVVRYNTLTNQIENNGFFPFAVGDGDWLQNDKNDVNFVLTAGGSCKSFNTATGQIRTATWPGHDECHLENNGRYVNLNTGDGGDGLWDLETNTTSAFNTPSGNIFHNASPSRYFTSVDVETGGGKTPHYRLDPVTKTGTKITDFCGYMSGFHHSGGWIQRGVPEEQQWVSISTYAGGNGCLKNAIGLMRLDNGDVRFLAHTYQSGNNYFQLPFGSLSAGGELLMFNSNSLGSRGDVYVVELPINGSVSPNPTPPPPTTQTQVVDGYIDSVSSSGVNGWFFSQKNDTSAVVTYVNVSTSATYTQTLTRSISRSDASSYLSSTYGSTLPVTQPLGFVGDPRSVLTVPGTYRIQSVKLNTSNTVIAISSAASATFVISSTQTPPPPPAPTPPPPAPTPPPPPAPSTSTVKLAINSPVANQTISANNVEVRMQIQVASGNTQDYSHVMIKLDNGSEVRVSGGIHLFSNVTSGSHTVSGYVAKADGSKIAGSESSVSFTVQNSNTTTPPPPTPTPPPPAPTPPTSGGSFNSTLPQNVSDRLPYGYLDGINQDGVVGGWAIDGNNANGFVDIHFYVDRGAGSGRTPAFSTKADKQRSDVGPHGFEVAVPAQFKDGRIHRLYAYGINQSDNSQWRQLLGSPVNFRLTASSSSSLPVRDDRDRLPYGYLDAVNATGLVTGWAVDGNDSEQSVDIHFYIDTAAGSGRTPSFTTKANVARADVGPHGFEASIPAAYRDGKTHRIYAYGINKSNSSQWRVLLGSPITFRYTGAQPSGGNSGLPLDLWKTGQDLPESKTFTYNVASMAQNSTKAVLALNVFDPDFSDEGQVCINNDSQCINLFGNMSNGDYQEINRDVNFETPASWWKAGANTLTFKHSQTDGYRIVNLSVTFGSGNVTPSPVPPPPTPTPPPPTPTPPPPAPNPPPPPTNQKPTGSFDGVNTTTKTIFGWAKDADTTSAITVHAYYAKNAGTTGATPVPCTAGDFRSDVGNFAFNCPIPSIYQNGVATQVWVWALDSASLASNNVQLTGSPRTFSIGTVTPTPPPPTPTPPPPAPVTTYKTCVTTANGVDSECPRVYVDTTIQPQSGQTIVVPAGGNLQTAINNAKLGDTIVLSPGAVYTGGFVLPNKTGSGWVTITTQGFDIPTGVRVKPSDASKMARLQSASGSVVQMNNNAHHFRFVGVEITYSGTADNFGLVPFDDDANIHHIIFDRVYIHGNSTANVKYAFHLSGSHNAVVDSYISEIHTKGSIFESYGVEIITGPGPFKVVNNYIESSTENVMFGGGTSGSGGLPQDVEIRYNHIKKPLSWHPDNAEFAGKAWDVKNLIEIKHGRRILVDSNVLEHIWPSDPTVYGGPQHGVTMLVWTADDSDGVTEDITFSNNYVRNVHAGIDADGNTKRMNIVNNMFENVGVSYMNNSRGVPYGAVKDGMIVQVRQLQNILIDHNTAIHSGNNGSFLMEVSGSTGVRVTNNIANNKLAGFSGAGLAKNVLIGSGSAPSGNFSVANIAAVGFVNAASSNYQLSSTSAYKNAGTDGKDIGVDFGVSSNVLSRVISGNSGGVVTPPPPPTNQKPTGSFDGVNTTTKTIFGWAKDADTTSAITVHAYYAKNAGTTGATPVPCTAGDFRSDVGNFAFNCPIPSIYQNGVATQVWVWALDSASLASNNVQLTGSPRTFSIGTVTPTPPPSGSLPGVSNTNGTVNAPPSSGAYAYSSWNPENNSFIALGQSYVDPVFGTTITRMSNQYPNTGSGLIYGKNGFWNANGTRYVHEHTSGNVIIDTTTGAIIRSSVPHSGGDASFDPVDPDAFYYYSGSKLMKLTVSSGATSTLKDFGSTLGAMGGTEDTISADGRYFVLVIAGNARVWDKQTDTLYSGQADGNFGGGWIGMAPDGSGFVVITGGAKKWHEINHATKSIDATGYVFSTEPGDHSTLMSASDGQTYYIKPEDDNTFAIYAHNVRTGAKKKLLQKSTSPGWCDDTHFSNIPRGPLKDWAVVDTEISAAGGTCGSADNTSANNWWKYRQSIILMNVLTGEIREIAHHRSRGNNVYCTGPRINANWDGTAMMFASNFGLTGIGGSCGYSDIYKVTWSGGVPTSPPPPPPPVANSSPVATINLPTSGTTFAAGDVINFSGSATDVQDGNLAASRLSWTIVFHHDTHTHPFEGPINGVSSGSFTIPRTGEPSDNIWYRISLTATDSNGATHTVTRDITPRKVQLTLATNPTGLQITLNGQPQTTPYTFTSVVGYNHVIGATSLQTLSGNTYAFANWGDGGAASKTITAPQTQTTYTANFTQTGTTNTVRDGYVDSFNSTKVAGWGYDNNQSTQVRIVYENVSNTSLTYTQTVAQTISRTDAASWLMTQYGSQLSVNQPLGFEADPRSVITQSGTYRIRSVTMVSSNTAVQISPAATAQVSITVGTTPPPPPPASGGTFTASVVASGLSNATAMEFAPDGRLFVAEKSGRLRVIKNGQLLSTPFVTLSVRDNGEAGLLGVAFDPNFASNNYVYVYYTTSANSHNRVSRFTANGDVAVGASEVALLDLPGLSNAYHHGGAIHFGTDGKLYIAVGDHENSSLAQSLSSPFGKMLRINSDGSIPTDNPYYNSATGINRAIWAFGFRNPFTFAVDGTTGKIYVNDVGQNTYEEINELVRGGNYGWPTCEGAQGSGVGNCNNTSFTYPVFVYSHSVGSAVTGGVFYRGSAYPSDYAGSYFFGDYTGGWIRRMTQSGQVSVWRSASGPIDLKVGTDGNLYMLSIYDGNITKYTYSQ